MWEGILIIGFLLLCITALLFRGAVTVLKRESISLREQDSNKGLMESFVEFSFSVILSLTASAALGFLFVGLLGLMGVPIDVP